MEFPGAHGDEIVRDFLIDNHVCHGLRLLEIAVLIYVPRTNGSSPVARTAKFAYGHKRLNPKQHQPTPWMLTRRKSARIRRRRIDSTHTRKFTNVKKKSKVDSEFCLCSLCVEQLLGLCLTFCLHILPSVCLFCLPSLFPFFIPLTSFFLLPNLSFPVSYLLLTISLSIALFQKSQLDLTSMPKNHQVVTYQSTPCLLIHLLMHFLKIVS